MSAGWKQFTVPGARLSVEQRRELTVVLELIGRAGAVDQDELSASSRQAVALRCAAALLAPGREAWDFLDEFLPAVSGYGTATVRWLRSEIDRAEGEFRNIGDRDQADVLLRLSKAIADYELATHDAAG